MSLSKEEILSNIYYDLERGYGSVQNLHKEEKKMVRVLLLSLLKIG